MTAGQVQDIPAETIGASYGDTLPAALPSETATWRKTK
jgi:hypothetical protein